MIIKVNGSTTVGRIEIVVVNYFYQTHQILIKK